jgi:hypothetical protein
LEPEPVNPESKVETLNENQAKPANSKLKAQAKQLSIKKSGKNLIS